MSNIMYNDTFWKIVYWTLITGSLIVIILKILKVIKWSWWWVISPFAITNLLFIGLTLLALFVGLKDN